MPLHSVTLSQYFMYKCEVSNAQFAKFLNEVGGVLDERRRPMVFEDAWGVQMHEGRYNPAPGFENHPVIQVTYFGAEKYAEWAGVRIPSEAQWERAASWDLNAGRRSFPWGNEFKKEWCNCADSWYRKEITTQADWIKFSRMSFDDAPLTRPVDSMPEGASPAGCLNMSGNVWEWCCDWYSENFYKSQASREQNPVSGYNTHLKVLRGGCFNKSAVDCRAQRRSRFGQSEHGRVVGFRCAKPAD
jgi:sulfatase modifying factor 1